MRAWPAACRAGERSSPTEVEPAACVSCASGARVPLGDAGECWGITLQARGGQAALALASSFVRDEEAAGSNPATPTKKFQTDGMIAGCSDHAIDHLLAVRWRDRTLEPGTRRRGSAENATVSRHRPSRVELRRCRGRRAWFTWWTRRSGWRAASVTEHSTRDPRTAPRRVQARAAGPVRRVPSWMLRPGPLWRRPGCRRWQPGWLPGLRTTRG